VNVYLGSYRDEGSLHTAVIVETVVVDVVKSLAGPASMRALLAKGQAYLDELFARATAESARGNVVGTVNDLRFGPPVVDPQKIICLGLNYRDHAEEAKLALPTAPVLFAKHPNSLIGGLDDVVVPPAASAAVDYEGELAVIIGARASRVRSEDALRYVAGYASFNDVSARDLQFASSQWGAGKAIDTFGPLGPYIVPRAAIPDPQDLMITTRVNGKQVQHASTQEMIFSVAETIAYITSFMTLEPGDVIATGTPAGIGFTRDPKLLLRDGDVVEVEIERIGTLRNAIVSEHPS
jgi:2-keto-4-pentenoate hydratase/2-oxohepta-3-ene-1,7-dioic acid hydratase in catechol pathway